MLGRYRGFFLREGLGGGGLLPYISQIGMCRPKGKRFCSGGILRISRDRDDRMGLKIKTRKKSLRLSTTGADVENEVAARNK